MGCTGSKQQQQQSSSSSTSPTTKPSKSKDKNKTKDKNSKNKDDKQKKNVTPSASSTLNNNTKSDSEKKDEIQLDRNLNNFINLHNRDIITFIVKEVKENLELKKNIVNKEQSTVVNGTDVSSVSPANVITNLVNNNNANSTAVNPEDTQVDLDSYISDITSKALQLCKNGKTKSYTQLNKALKESKVPAINEKSLICDLVVDVLHKYLIIINDNKLNKDFDLNNYITNLKAQQQQQQQQQSLSQTPETVDTNNTSSNNNNNITSNVNNINNPIAYTQTQNERVLTWNEANKVARHLFLTSRAQPNIHASNFIEKGYILTKIKQINNDKYAEVALTSAEIDDVLNPRPFGGSVAINEDGANIADESTTSGANAPVGANNKLNDDSLQLTLDETLTNYSNLINNFDNNLNSNNNNNNKLNDTLNEDSINQALSNTNTQQDHHIVQDDLKKLEEDISELIKQIPADEAQTVSLADTLTNVTSDIIDTTKQTQEPQQQQVENQDDILKDSLENDISELIKQIPSDEAVVVVDNENKEEQSNNNDNNNNNLPHTPSPSPQESTTPTQNITQENIFTPSNVIINSLNLQKSIEELSTKDDVEQAQPQQQQAEGRN